MPSRTLPAFRSLGDFIAHLEAADELVRISEPISVVHEMTEIHRRVLRGNGRALLFEHAVKADGARSEMPVLVNLFGTLKRIAWGLGVEADAGFAAILTLADAAGLPRVTLGRRPE